MVRAIDIVKSQRTETSSNWAEKAKWRRENKEWLRYSSHIALAVLNRMSGLGITQKALAERMGCSQQYISTLLKGEENLTLETISKLEKALDFDLIGRAFRGRYNLYQNEAHLRYLNAPDIPYGKPGKSEKPEKSEKPGKPEGEE